MLFIIMSTIAIVGNGSLSEDQRSEISKHDIVVRFNGIYNYREGEKSNIIYFRCNPGVKLLNKKDNPFPGFTAFDKHTAKYDAQTYIYISPHDNKKHLIPEMAKYYNSNYHIIQKHEFPDPPNKRLTWSSGFFGVLDMKRNYPNHIMHIYGMCWPDAHGIPGSHEEKRIRKIPNVIIHNTPTNEYHGCP